MVRLFSRSKINLNLSKASILQEEQIKGRNFEIPGAGGFQLSFDADNLTDYYKDEKEIVVVRSIEEMDHAQEECSRRPHVARIGRVRSRMFTGSPSASRRLLHVAD